MSSENFRGKLNAVGKMWDAVIIDGMRGALISLYHVSHDLLVVITTLNPISKFWHVSVAIAARLGLAKAFKSFSAAEEQGCGCADWVYVRASSIDLS